MEHAVLTYRQDNRMITSDTNSMLDLNTTAGQAYYAGYYYPEGSACF